jgi:hypothetical protein
MDLLVIAKGTDYGSSIYTIFKETQDLPKPAQAKKKVVPKPSSFQEPPAARPFNVNDYLRESADKAKHGQMERSTSEAGAAAKKLARKKAAKTAAKVVGGAALTAAAWKAGKHVPGARKTIVAGGMAAGAAAGAKPAAKWGLKKLKAAFTSLSPAAKKKIAAGSAATAAAGAVYGGVKAAKVLREARNARSGAGAGGGVGSGGRGGRGGRGRRGGGGGAGGAGSDAAASAANRSAGFRGASPLGWTRQYKDMTPQAQAVVRRRAGLAGAGAGGAFVGADLQHRRNHAV